MAALRVTPDGEAVAGADLLDGAGGANGIEHGAPFADADQVGMHPRRAEAGIVGRHDHIAMVEQLDDARHLRDHIGNERRRAMTGDARVGIAAATIGRPPGGVCPSGRMTTPETAIGFPSSPVER